MGRWKINACVKLLLKQHHFCGISSQTTQKYKGLYCSFSASFKGRAAGKKAYYYLKNKPCPLNNVAYA